MKLFLVLFFAVLTGTFSYPDVRIDQRVLGWSASGTVHYIGCSNDDFELEFPKHFEHYRGACLIKEISALMIKGDQTIWASPFWSSGTGYAQFEIVRCGNGDNFCVQIVGSSSDRLNDV